MPGHLPKNPPAPPPDLKHMHSFRDALSNQPVVGGSKWSGFLVCRDDRERPSTNLPHQGLLLIMAGQPIPPQRTPHKNYSGKPMVNNPTVTMTSANLGAEVGDKVPWPPQKNSLFTVGHASSLWWFEPCTKSWSKPKRNFFNHLENKLLLISINFTLKTTPKVA